MQNRALNTMDDLIELVEDLYEAGCRFEFWDYGKGWFYYPEASNTLLSRPQGAALPFYEAAKKFWRTWCYVYGEKGGIG